jgi:cell division septation protein DedD
VRALVFLLVFANLLFYAFSAGYFGRSGSDDAHRLTQQVHPERLRIVSRGEAPAVTEDRGTSAAEPAPVPLPAGAAAASGASVCLAWEGLSEADARRIGDLLGSRFADFRVERKAAGEQAVTQWWVFIPPLSNRAESERKAGQLRSLGVTDYFVVSEGAQRHAISLGIFSAQNRAEERLAELKAKGVRSARMGERPGRESAYLLRAVGPQAQHAALLAALAGVDKGEPRECR